MLVRTSGSQGLVGLEKIGLFSKPLLLLSSTLSTFTVDSKASCTPKRAIKEV